MDTPTSFGYWVRRRRKALDLTQAELARRVGCAEVTIQKIESDERRPSTQVAELLAEQLQIGPAERQAFLRSARGEAAADRLPNPQAELPAGDRPAAPHHNLPVQLTSFVGRERELATTAGLLAANRLVTLTGPGGTGKTRLALQLAETLLGRFPDGVWLVELASLADPALIPQAIASVLNVREQPGRALMATLAAHLRDKHMLLVLDNCEHLIDACAQLSEALLHASPRLRILASSREPLSIGGEAILRVPALAVPSLGQLPAPDPLSRIEAVQLFVARARTSLPDFEVTAANAAPLAQICVRLDGIPLAIELAAARVRMLTVAQIAARLDDRFRLLTGGSRTALPRHQTLQALIDWSYELLAEDERALLRRLAVCAGGWSIEAAEAIGVGGAVAEALRPLAQLVDKSLVEVEPGEEVARYRMLETIRQYALAKLAASGEADAVRRRHALYYLELAETLEKAPRGWAGRMAQLQIEHDNLRAALAFCHEGRDAGLEARDLGLATGDQSPKPQAPSPTPQTPSLAEIGLRLVRVSEAFWVMRGYWTEGRSWLTDALAHPQGAQRTHLRAEVLDYLASVHAYLNDYGAAQATFSESLSICQELGDANGRAWVLNRLGWLAREQGDAATARARLEQSLELFRELGDSFGIINGLNTLGGVAVMQEDAAWGAALLDESLAMGQSLDDTYNQAWTLNHLGHVAQIEGEYLRAAQLHERSLELFRRSGEQHLGTAWALHGLAECALAQADLAGAQEQFAASLAQFRYLGDRSGVAWCLAGLGSLAALSQAPERAARLWGAGEALRAALGCRSAPAARPTYERAMAAARVGLGEVSFAAAWAAGQALALEDAIAQAPRSYSSAEMHQTE